MLYVQLNPLLKSPGAPASRSNSFRLVWTVTAWNLLSNSCEQMLDPGQGRPRAKVPRPTVAASAPVKQHALQSVRERRLRRTLRRLEELGKPQAPWRIVPKVRAELDKLQRSYPELSEFAVGDPCFRCSKCAFAKRGRPPSKSGFSDGVRACEDDKALVRWVKGADLTCCPASDSIAVPVHPQAKAEHFAQLWSEVWNPDTPPRLEDVDPFLQWIPPEGFECEPPRLTGADLKSRARQAANPVAGPDGWNANDWLLLPDDFFQAFADLWNRVLDTGTVPTQWTCVRCCLIPKEVGFRPISIAALAWRLGVGAVVQRLSSWIDEWAPPELAGGLKGRCASQAHQELHESLQNPLVFGAKLDLSKCFDHVDWRQALRVWDRLGAPATVTSVLKAFYTQQSKTMEWQGACKDALAVVLHLQASWPLGCTTCAPLPPQCKCPSS